MSHTPNSRPTWQLPEGVSRGAWDYVNTRSIATEYDSFHRDHPLLAYDQQVILTQADFLDSQPLSPSSTSVPSKIAIDLGCGTGRSLFPLAERGWRAIGIDLSEPMLQEVRTKIHERSVCDSVATIHANMVEFNFLKENSIDLALCMYSSIGMIRGRSNRRRVFQAVARTLKRTGRFIVHVHNRGAWIRDPNGIRLTLDGWWKELRKADWELGDRIYSYRGLPNMFLHIYSRKELEKDLRSADLKIIETLSLNRHSSGPLGYPRFFPHFRAGGFIAIAASSE